VPPYRISEAETRFSIIDPQLKKAGWNVNDRTQVGIEIPVSGYDTSSRDGFTDYCLLPYIYRSIYQPSIINASYEDLLIKLLIVDIHRSCSHLSRNSLYYNNIIRWWFIYKNH